jgi:hypothetical protein
MKTLAACLLLGLTLFALAGCPEKKPEGDGANTAVKPASSSPAAAPAAKPATKPTGGGW